MLQLPLKPFPVLTVTIFSHYSYAAEELELRQVGYIGDGPK